MNGREIKERRYGEMTPNRVSTSFSTCHHACLNPNFVFINNKQQFVNVQFFDSGRPVTNIKISKLFSDIKTYYKYIWAYIVAITQQIISTKLQNRDQGGCFSFLARSSHIADS
jgi:hypothetical protein